MKTNNKKKVVVSVLALAMGAGLAGSISGSVAWYQYSTRTAALIQGTSAGTLGRLQIAQHVEQGDPTFQEKLTISGQNFQPTTIKRVAGQNQENDTLTFLKHPVYQVAQLSAVDSETPWIDLKFNFRFQESTDGSEWNGIANDNRNIYLSHFAIVSVVDEQHPKDVSDAVRVAFLDGAGKAKCVFAKTTSQETITKGNLDLNGNHKLDTMLWDCTDSDYDENAQDTHAILYTNGADSYTADAHANWVLTTEELSAHAYDLDDVQSISAKALCTVADTLTIRVWLEGWTLFGNSTTADWTSDYIAQNFNIQLQFACEAEH